MQAELKREREIPRKRKKQQGLFYLLRRAMGKKDGNGQSLSLPATFDSAYMCSDTADIGPWAGQGTA